MQIRRIFVCLILFFAYWSVALAQTGAQITLSQVNVTAGDSIEVKLTIDGPYPCATDVYVDFVNSATGDTYELGPGRISSGGISATLKGDLPRDLPTGDYTSKRVFAQACPGYRSQKGLNAPVRTLTVKALPDQTHYPTSAKLELSVTQKQFLDTKIAQLSSLSSNLDTGVQGNSAELPKLREFLIGIVDSAEDALIVTEKQYREQILKPNESLPVFFADFHAQYQALRINLRAPIPGLARANLNSAAKLKYVQLKTRPPSQQLANTRSPDITAVWQTIKDNIAAYLKVKDTGRITFNARLRSYPTGASIVYRKLIDNDFFDYSSPTDVQSATFDLATYEFRFHKEGCTDVVRHIDPYQENDPVEIAVELVHCKGK